MKTITKLATGAALTMALTGVQADTKKVGIAGFWGGVLGVHGECNKKDKYDVSSCTSKKNGKAYYIWKEEKYKSYPEKAREVKK